MDDRLTLILDARNNAGPAIEQAKKQIEGLQKTYKFPLKDDPFLAPLIKNAQKAGDVIKKQQDVERKEALATFRAKQAELLKFQAQLQKMFRKHNEDELRARQIAMETFRQKEAAARRLMALMTVFNREMEAANRRFQAQSQLAFNANPGRYLGFRDAMADKQAVQLSPYQDSLKFMNFKQGVHNMQLLANAADSSSKAIFNSFNSMLSNLTAPFHGFYELVRGMFIRLAAVAGIFAGIQVIKNIISAGMYLEQQRAMLEALSGSAQKAGNIIEWVRKKALGTPFQVPGLIDATTQLMSVGMSYQKWVEPLGALAIMTGRGMEEGMEMATRAVVRLKSGVTGEAMELLRRMKITREDFAKNGIFFSKSGESLSTPNKMLEALYNIIQTKFPNVMQKLGSTTVVTFSDMQDAVNEFYLTIAGVSAKGEISKGGFLGTVKSTAEDALKWFKENQKTVSSWGAVIGRAFANAIKWVIQHKDTIKEWGTLIISIVTNVLTAYWNVLQGLVGVFATLLGVTVGSSDATGSFESKITNLLKTIERLTEKFKAYGKTIGVIFALTIINRWVAVTVVGISKVSTALLKMLTWMRAGGGMEIFFMRIRIWMVALREAAIKTGSVIKKIFESDPATWQAMGGFFRAIGTGLKTIGLAIGSFLISPVGILIVAITALVAMLTLLNRGTMNAAKEAREASKAANKTQENYTKYPKNFGPIRIAQDKYGLTAPQIQAAQYMKEYMEMNGEWVQPFGFGPKAYRQTRYEAGLAPEGWTIEQMEEAERLVNIMKQAEEDSKKIQKGIIEAENAAAKAAAEEPVLLGPLKVLRYKVEDARAQIESLKSVYEDTSIEVYKARTSLIELLKTQYEGVEKLVYTEGTEEWYEWLKRLREINNELIAVQVDIRNTASKIQEDAIKQAEEAADKWRGAADAVVSYGKAVSDYYATLYDTYKNYSSEGQNKSLVKALYDANTNVMSTLYTKSQDPMFSNTERIAALTEILKLMQTQQDLAKTYVFGNQSDMVKVAISQAEAHLNYLKASEATQGAVRLATISVIKAKEKELELAQRLLRYYLQIGDAINAGNASAEISKIRTEILELQKSMRTNMEDEFSKMASMMINAPANLTEILARTGIAYWQRSVQFMRRGMNMGGYAYAGAGANAQIPAPQVYVNVSIDGTQLDSRIDKRVKYLYK